MINDKSFTVSTIVKLIEHPHYTFYLTGSRYFGGARDDSDYDFFTEFSLNLYAWLKALGFKDVQSAYQDKSVQKVLVHNDTPCSGNVPIHIQLVKDAEFKNKVQESLPKELMRVTPHSHRCALWDYALDAVAR